MPTFRVTAPDGKSYEVTAPDGATQQEIIAYVQANASRLPQAGQRSDFIDDLQRGFGQAVQSIGSAAADLPIETLASLGRRAQATGREIVEANPADMQRVQDIGSVSDALTFAGERIAETIPQIIAPAAIGGAALLSGAAAPVAGALGLGARALSSFAQTYGGIREEHRAAGIDDKGRAALAAVPAAALDVFGVGRLVPGAGRVLGDVVEGGLRGAARTAGRIGAEEGVIEVAQTALERAGAAKPLTDQEAIDEYINALAAGTVAGGAIGGVSGLASRRQPETGEPIVEPTTPEPTPAPQPGSPAPVSGPAPTEPTVAPTGTGSDVPGVDWYGVNPEDGFVTAVIGGETRTFTPDEWQAFVATAAPVTPTEPVAAPEPTTTPEPVAPVEPSAPAEPIAPVQPVAPVEPSAPVEPIAPVQPVAPVEPATPTEPLIPVQGSDSFNAALSEESQKRFPGNGVNDEANRQAFTYGATNTPLPAAAPDAIRSVWQAGREWSATIENAPSPVEPATPQQQEQSRTATQQFAEQIRGRTLTQVSDYLSKNAVVESTRAVMGRATGVLKAFERAGVPMDFGISDDTQRGTAAKAIKGERKRGVRGMTAITSARGKLIVGLSGFDRPVPGVQEATAAHEIIHAVTMTAIDHQHLLPKNSRVNAAVTELKNLASDVQKFMRKDKSEYAKEQRSTRGRVAYLTDPNEVIAWGLTDPEFQNYLKTIPTKTGNAFTDFVRYIGRILGIGQNEQNALARLIELTNDIIPVEAAEIKAVADAVRRRSDEIRSGKADIGDAKLSQSIQTRTGPDTLDYTPETRKEWFLRNWIDRLRPLQRVEGLGTLVNANRSAYEAGRRVDSAAGARIEKFDRDFFQPIFKGLREAGIQLKDFDYFLWARAAPGRNARIANRQIVTQIIEPLERASGKKYRPNYVGVDGDPQIDFNNFVEAEIENARDNGEIFETGSGMDNQTATDILDHYRSMPNGAEFDRIAGILDEMNNERRRLMVQNGLISQETADSLAAAEPFYVPMKGRAESAADLTVSADPDDVLIGYGGSGFSISRREWQQTKGRTSPPFSPLGTAISDAQTSIVRGERNRVGQLFLEFATRNPSSQWKVYSETNPPLDRNGNKIAIRPNDPNWVITKVNGKSFFVNMENEMLARAVRNLSAEEMRGFMNWKPVQLFRDITRAWSRSLTTANPVFFVPNVLRDIAAAQLNLAGDPRTEALARGFVSRAGDPRFMRAIWNLETGQLFGWGSAADPQDVALYEQFKLDGGAVGWVQRDTPQAIAERIKSDYEALQLTQQQLSVPRTAAEAKLVARRALSSTSRAGRALVNTVEHFNSTFENGIRFAAYRAALDAGMSREQAAMIARDVTVDFNRAGEAARFVNAFYSFFNASIQGSARTLRSLSNNPWKTGKLSKTQSALIAAASMASVLALANAGMSAEDDDGELFYDKIPTFEKERNLIIMSPVNGRDYVKIPLPYGFSFFPYMATRVTDAMRKGDMENLGSDMFSATLTNFSPVQFQSENVFTGVAKAATPTLGRPFMDILMNENAFGKPIRNEPFSEAQSAASAARYGTPEIYKWWAQTLNDISGGDGRIPDVADTSPENWQYLVNFAMAGVNQHVGSLFGAYQRMNEGRDLGVRDVPLLDKIAGTPQEGRHIGRFYERESAIQAVSMNMRAAETFEERRAIRERYPVESSPSVQAALKKARSEVRSINQQKKALNRSNLPSEEIIARKRELNERVDRAFIRFNTVYNREKERAG